MRIKILPLIVCSILLIAMSFYCGMVNQQFRYHKENTNELHSYMNLLRNEIFIMNTVVSRSDYDLSKSDKSCFGILTSSANVYTCLPELISDAGNFEYYEDKLSYSRPSIYFIDNLTRSIMLAEIEDYRQIFNEALPFFESYSEDIWEWLDNLDSKLQDANAQK